MSIISFEEFEKLNDEEINQQLQTIGLIGIFVQDGLDSDIVYIERHKHFYSLKKNIE